MRLASKLLSLLMTMAMVCPSVAQNWTKINTHYDAKYNFNWSFPYELNQFSYSDFSSDQNKFLMHVAGPEDQSASFVPYAVSMIDSVTFVNETPEEQQTHNKYQVYTLSVTTNGSVGVDSREEYVGCYVSLDGKDGYNWYSAPASIRGRGNSTWSIYPKKADTHLLRLDRAEGQHRKDAVVVVDGYGRLELQYQKVPPPTCIGYIRSADTSVRGV